MFLVGNGAEAGTEVGIDMNDKNRLYPVAGSTYPGSTIDSANMEKEVEIRVGLLQTTDTPISSSTLGEQYGRCYGVGRILHYQHQAMLRLLTSYLQRNL